MLSLIPLLPFTGFLINATLGRRLTKGVSGAVACLAMLGAFAVSRGVGVAAAGARARARPRHRRAPLYVDRRRQLPRRPGLPPRSAVDADDPGRHRHRLADPHLFDRLHARGDERRVRALLLLPEPVRQLHAGAGARRQPAGDVHRLGGRRPLLLPADRLLVQEAVGQRRRQEGVRRQPHRRLRLHPRRRPDLRDLRHRRLPRARAQGRADGQRGRDLRHALDHHAAVLHRGDRQVGPDPALRLAAGRDGGPDAGLGPDPRRDDGHGRRLHDRPQRRALLRTRRRRCRSSR